MRYSQKTEATLVAEINAHPDAPLVIGGERAYWRGDPQPWVHIDGQRVRLLRHLHEIIIGPISPGAGLFVKPGVDERNVNPHLAVVTASPHHRPTCPNGHEYEQEDVQADGSMRCHTCYSRRLTGGENPIEVNRAKITCPKGHALVLRPNGRRRCLECPRIQQDRYAQRKRQNA